MSEEISDAGKMSCYNKMTKEFVGFMGTHGNDVSLVQNEADAVDVHWVYDGEDTYLAKVTSPNDRYLAVTSGDYAGWDLWANVNLKPVVLNSDGTISLKSNKNIRLYGPVRSLGNDYISWTSEQDTDNSNILVFKKM